MSWGNTNEKSSSGWENNADAAWPTAESAPAGAVPAITVSNSAGEGNGHAPEAKASQGETAEATEAADGAGVWQTQDDTRYNYAEFGDRDGEYEGSARVYHWDGVEGDIGPEFPELELEIFGPIDQRGDNFGPDIAT